VSWSATSEGEPAACNPHMEVKRTVKKRKKNACFFIVFPKVEAFDHPTVGVFAQPYLVNLLLRTLKQSPEPEQANNLLN
jgi:hypothetical protein